MFFGDSETQGQFIAYGSGSGGPFEWPNGNSWVPWAIAASGGRIRPASPIPVFAQGGRTSGLVLTEQIPLFQALATPPTFATLLIGTNDLGGNVVMSTFAANIKAIHTAVSARGTTLILCSVPPRNDFASVTMTNGLTPTAMNGFLRRYAWRNNLPFVDFTTLLTDPTTGSYYAGMYADTIHPSSAGYKLMGQAFAAAVMGQAPWTWRSPFLSITNAAQGSDTANLAAVNALLQTDANADGLPDGWAISSGGTGATHSLDAVPAGEGRGSYYTLTRGSNDVSVQGPVWSTRANGTDRFMLAFRFKSNVQSSAARAEIQLVNQGGTGSGGTFFTWISPVDWDAGSVFTGEFVPPAAVTGYRFRLSVLDAAGGTVSLAQPTLINLTASGMDA